MIDDATDDDVATQQQRKERRAHRVLLLRGKPQIQFPFPVQVTPFYSPLAVFSQFFFENQQLCLFPVLVN